MLQRVLNLPANRRALAPELTSVHNQVVLTGRLRVGNAAEVGIAAEQMDRACRYVEASVVSGRVPLAEVIVGRHGSIVARGSWVHPTVAAQGLAIRADTAYYLGSFTKIFVATLVMQQVERGTIMLERPVSLYIPEFGQCGKASVKVRHLLCHASGLPDELSVPATHVAPAGRFLEEIYRQPLVFTPGTRGSYCTWGYVVLAEILRRVTGKSLEEMGKSDLFAPMGMEDTQFGLDPLLESRLVPIYGAGLVRHPSHNPQMLAMVRGDTGAYSSARDLAAFCHMMLSGGKCAGTQVLSPVSVQRMVEPQFPWWDTPERLSGVGADPFDTVSKGLGWMVRGRGFYRGSDLMSPTAYFHGGFAGMRVVIDPLYDFFSVFLTSFVGDDTEGAVPEWIAGHVHHTFHTMAAAAIVEV
jgi:CubicO group peptidase (beta-lactamase class C family)